MLAKFSLQTKLMGLCVSLAMMTAALATVNKVAGDDISTSYQHVLNINLPNMIQLGDMRSEYKKARIGAFRIGLEHASKASLESAHKEMNEGVAEYEAAAKTYERVEFTAGEKELYESVAKIWTDQKAVFERIDKLATSDDKNAHEQLTDILNGDFADAATAYDAAMGKLMAFHTQEAEKWGKDAIATDDHAESLGIGMGAVAVALALVLGYLVSRGLSRTLSTLASRLSDGAGAVAGAAKEISEASTEASASTTETAAALQETVASIDEVSAMVGKNADNAKRSVDASGAGKQAAARGKQAVDDMLASIDDISRSNGDIMAQTEAGNQEIGSIVKIIAEIGNKTKVINDIVFQTKLLSFNASVEAARAGEHGKGFAVVAEEVGNLAQMSGNAAKEISQMLEESIRKVETTVNDTRSRIERLITAGREKVETGTVTARRCGEALDEIVRQVGDLNHMVGEISTASREQAQGVAEISKALSQIDQGMQQTSTVAGQTANASEHLQAQSEVLDRLVDELVATVAGAGPASRRTDDSRSPAARTPVQRHAKRSASTASVLPMRKRPAPTAHAARPAAATAKRVVGGEDLPAEDDPRFEDV
jgi:methyl-accepting chemotaxis protein